MAIPNIVPRNNNDGETLGTAQKHWSNVFAEDVTVGNKSLASVINSVDALSTSVGSLSTSVTELSDGKVDKASPKNADGKDLALAENVLALSGGTMTGDVSFTSGAIKKSATNSFLELNGGTDYTNGATLVLGGKDSTNEDRVGGFILQTGNGNASETKILKGTTNGSLTWNGKDVETVVAQGYNYIRYKSGLQICWDSYQTNRTVYGGEYNEFHWTYPASFISLPKIFANAYHDRFNVGAKSGGDSTTDATIYYVNDSGNTYTLDWVGLLAIGRWK